MNDCPSNVSPVNSSDSGSLALVVSTLASSASGTEFDPRVRQGKIVVSQHAFLGVICRNIK